MRDGISNIQVKRGISPQYVLDSSALVSQIIDRQGFDALSFLIATGSIGDANATFAVLVEDGDDSGLSDAAAVADDELVSQTPGTAPETAAAFQFDDDNEVRKIGYIGNKRYVRVTITPTGNSVASASPSLGAFIAVLALLGEGRRPITQATA
jgi:hypothetical protein